MAGRDKKPALLKKPAVVQLVAKDSHEAANDIVAATTATINTAETGLVNNASVATTAITTTTTTIDTTVATSTVITTTAVCATKTNPTKPDVPKLEAVPSAEFVLATAVKQVRKPRTKKTIKKNLKINFKTKAKKTKNLKLPKSIFKGNKLNLDAIKNGIKTSNRKRKLPTVKQDVDLLPPVLEPMVPIPETINPSVVKKEPKKRVRKAPVVQDVSGTNETSCDKKPKISTISSINETIDDVLNDVANELQIDIDALMKKRKKKIIRKQKAPAAASVELKPTKKPTTPKKLKIESPKPRKSIKKENIIESLCKDITLDSEAQNVINSLDLNVNKTARKKAATKKRRHSIEKMPGVADNFEQPFILFTNTRRSASPKSKRNARVRQSIEGSIPKRFSPYTTRSDSPARILRNGKHRKLKDLQLLDGLDSSCKKRRRLCSEFSGSELSKGSEYLSESDSSFSDLASVQENGMDSPSKDDGNLIKSELIKKEILDSVKVPINETTNELQNLNIKQISSKFTAILKRSLSTDTAQQQEPEDVKPSLTQLNFTTDTNSNDVKLPKVKSEVGSSNEDSAMDTIIKTETDTVAVKTELSEKIASSPSEKVPDKSLILNKMKQNFNDSKDECEKRKTRSSKRNLKLEDETLLRTEESDEKNSEELMYEHEEEVPNDIQELEVEEEINEENVNDDLLSLLKENSSISLTAVKDSKKEETQTTQECNVGDVENGCSDANNVCSDTNNDCSSTNIDSKALTIQESPEEQAIKENILKALGLRSLKSTEQEKINTKEKLQQPSIKPDDYTGTLKTVIKLNRQNENNNNSKKKRNPLKMTLQKSGSTSGGGSKTRTNVKDEDETTKSDASGTNVRNETENSCYKVMKESVGNSAGWRHGSHSSDTAGANRKSHYSNRSNMDASSEHASDGDVPVTDGDSGASSSTTTKALVIPEKASSFSIHPDRLCSDECAYCFGKFGLFDTPLHIAQIKSVERQNKILDNEIYLMRDSCLCDACYRHIDRRVNSPAFTSTSKNCKRTSSSSNSVLNPAALPRPSHCHVIGCENESSHVFRRKWIMKMRRIISRTISLDLHNPSLHSIPVCADHYAAVEHLIVCSLCKRRLARNHIHYLSFQSNNLNAALEKEGIPVTFVDKPVVCKLCRYFVTLLLKPAGEIKGNSINFFKQYKKRLLHFHDIEVMDEAETEEPISVPLKEKSEVLKKQRKTKPKPNNTKTNGSDQSMLNSSEQSTIESSQKIPEQTRVPFSINRVNGDGEGDSRESTSPTDTMVDIETLIPNLVLECETDENNKSEVPVPPPPTPPPSKFLYKPPLPPPPPPIPESLREAVEISKAMKSVKRHDVVDRLGSNPSISVRQLFPGEEDLPLQGHIDFNAVKERTPEGWEKCSCTIQYDVDTKHLWQELQKPYGNQSSFLRHLILLEKYFRNGDLTLSANASHHAVNYSVSVQNRLRAYDNIPTNSLPMQPLTMLPFNQIKKSQSGIITTKEPVVNAANIPKSTPISLTQLNPNFLSQLSSSLPQQNIPLLKPKPQNRIPPLISLQQSSNKSKTPQLKLPQKFRLPVNRNWRPTLIPISATQNASEKRLTGLVQVISSGKPYHISLQDYNRMCMLKKAIDLKQQKLKGEGGDVNTTASTTPSTITTNSILKPIISRKPRTVVTKPSLQQIPASVLETLSSKTSTSTSSSSTGTSDLKPKSIMVLPKIPKSLTVIPQTAPRRPLPPPSSPTLSIISAKASTSTSKS